MSEIVCTGFKRIDKGLLVGFASVFVPKWGLEIFGISLFEKNGKKWISMPSREYEDKNEGKKKYFPHIKFREKSHAELFEEKVKAAIEKFNGDHPSQDSIFDQELGF